MNFKDNIEFKINNDLVKEEVKEELKQELKQEPKKQSKKISNEQQNKYNKSFYESHKGEKILCNICQIEYSKFNKSHHMNGKLHKQIVKIMNKN
jgi:hypothetical protein